MKPNRFDPDKDLAPMPFDEKVCLQALEMKKCGLSWRPHVGCFVWDPDESIKAPSPFPGRIYFILSLQRFIEIFDTIEQIAEKLVWLPTWHQARLTCRQLGIADQTVEERRKQDPSSSPNEDLLHIYEMIINALKDGRTQA